MSNFWNIGFTIVFLNPKIWQKNAILAPASPRKSMNTESPNVVSKRLKTYYLRSCAQFFGKSDLLVNYLNQKFDKKIRYKPQKVQKD